MAREWPITLADASERLGCAHSTVSLAVNILEIPARRIGVAKCIDEAGFRLLKARLKNLPGRPNYGLRKKEREAAAVS